MSKGSVNITDLPTGEYRVTVYDHLEDYLDDILPAYINSKLVQQVSVIDLNSSTTSSVSSMGVTGKILVLFISGYGFSYCLSSFLDHIFIFNSYTSDNYFYWKIIW